MRHWLFLALRSKLKGRFPGRNLDRVTFILYPHELYLRGQVWIRDGEADATPVDDRVDVEKTAVDMLVNGFLPKERPDSVDRMAVTADYVAKSATVELFYQKGGEHRTHVETFKW